MTSWGDDEPIFVDTATSDTEEPRSAGWILWLGVAAAVGVVGLTLAALSLGDDTTPVTDEAEPTVESEPTPSPTADAGVDPDDGILTSIETFAKGFGSPTRLSSDGSSVCVDGRGFTAFDACRDVWDEGDAVDFEVTGADPIACIFGSAAPTVDRVEFENPDGTFSVVELHSIDRSGARAFVICRPQLVGISRLAAYDTASNPVFSAGSRERPILEDDGSPADYPRDLVVDIPPGWHIVRLSRVTMVSNRRLAFIESDEDPFGPAGLCNVRQLMVLADAADDAVVIVATTIGPTGLGDDETVLVFEPADVSDTASSCGFGLDGRTAVVGRAMRLGQEVEVAMVEGPGVADDVRQQAEVIAAMLQPASAVDSERRSEDLGLGSLGASGVWTGSEVLLSGGSSFYSATAFSIDEGLTSFDRGSGGSLVGMRPSNAAAAYDPRTGSWRKLAGAAVLELRPGASSTLWTGHEWLVFGSHGLPSARYDLGLDAWMPIAPAPGASEDSLVRGSAWVAGEAYVWFEEAGLSQPGDGYAYDPDTNTWRSVALAPDVRGSSRLVATESEVFLIGSRGLFASYSPEADAWTILPESTIRPSTEIQAAAFTSDGLVVFAPTFGPPGAGRVRTVHIYDPSSGSWTDEELPRETAGVFSSSLFVGDNLIVFPSPLDEQTGEVVATPAFIRRPGGQLVELPLPPDWDRCGSTFVAMDDAVLAWGGTQCDEFSNGYHDAVVIDIPS